MLIFSILSHSRSFMVYYYLFAVFLSQKLLFSGFLQFKGNFVRSQNNSKYRDWAPLRQTLCWRLNFNLSDYRSKRSIHIYTTFTFSWRQGWRCCTELRMTTQLSEPHQNCQDIGVIMENAASLEISEKRDVHAQLAWASVSKRVFGKTFHVKMSLICMKMNLWAKHVSIWMVSH